jgi:hypothetical protein
VQHSQAADEVDDLGAPEQPAHAEDVVGHPVPSEGLDERGKRGLGSEQERGGALLAVGVGDLEGAAEPERHPVGLVDEGLAEGHLDLPVGRPAAGPEPPDLDLRGPGELVDDPVGRVEHPDRVPPARRQGERRAGCGTEVVGETAQVRRAGATEAVDRLVRVADGHDARAGEEAREQARLHDAGVLIFVEQDDAETLPVLPQHCRLGLADPERERDLIGELDEAAALLLEREPLGEVEERRQGGDGGGGRRDAQVGRALGGRQGRHVEEPLGHRLDARRLGHVLAEGVAQRDHRLGERVDGAAETRQAIVGARDDEGAGELPGRRLAEHLGLALAAHEERVVAEDRVREGVVRRDRRSVERVELRVEEPLLAEQQDALLDPFRQLARRLAGEGEAEDLRHRHQPVGQEPHDPARHRLGLAASGPRDDERRLEGGLDDALLLECGRIEVQARGHVERRIADAGHWVTSPTTWMEQDPPNRPVQWSSTRARKTLPAMPAASSRTR